MKPREEEEEEVEGGVVVLKVRSSNVASKVFPEQKMPPYFIDGKFLDKIKNMVRVTMVL